MWAGLCGSALQPVVPLGPISLATPRAMRVAQAWPACPLAPLTTTLLPSRDLNHNDLREFPVAIRTLGRLQEL